MKIILLDLGKNIRGGQRQVLYLARRLSESTTFSPIAVVPRSAPLKKLMEEAGIPVLTLPSHGGMSLFNVFRFKKILDTEQPAIVHTNDAKGASLAALMKRWRGNFKLVHSRRVSYALKGGWSRRKYQLGDAIVAVSSEIEGVLNYCGIPQEKTRTIHSGINAELYTREKRPHAIPTIGCVGALTTQKGFSVLIEALGLLPEQQDWRCMIAGSGPLEQELQQQAERLGLQDRITLLGYKDSRDVLPDYDILVVPSVDGEGSNGVIKEGWVSDTPVITSDLPSNLELVSAEKDGLVFPNGNAQKLAESLMRLLSDQELAAKLVHEGRKTVLDFTDKAMAERYQKLYLELTSAG